MFLFAIGKPPDSTLGSSSADFHPENGSDTFLQTSIHIRTARRCVLEDSNFQNYRCQNLESHIYE